MIFLMWSFISKKDIYHSEVMITYNENDIKLCLVMRCPFFALRVLDLRIHNAIFITKRNKENNSF